MLVERIETNLFPYNYTTILHNNITQQPYLISYYCDVCMFVLADDEINFFKSISKFNRSLPFFRI